MVEVLCLIKRSSFLLLPVVGLCATLAGCSATQNTGAMVSGAKKAVSSYLPAGDVSILSAQYNARTHVVTLAAKPIGALAIGENIVDVHSSTGVSNYVAARFPGKDVRSVTLHAQGHTTKLPVSQSTLAVTVQAPHTIQIPPPGTTMDPTLHPLAGPKASQTAKFHAVLSVAISKMGTPYIWGHNEDRGQYGFDCSNFTAYVYHHALGYNMSGSSQMQYHQVGVPIATRNMRPGDLMVFDQGGHVGIFVGHGQMIEEGGGIGKVGYLSVKPGSYWGNHITVIKRMF